MGDFLVWNPWRGCRKEFTGCKNCWMHIIATSHGLAPNEIVRSKTNWNAPVAKDVAGQYKIAPGSFVNVCLTSDFCLEDVSDEWRQHVWEIIARRPDVAFAILTKRAARLSECLPDDWLDEDEQPKYENVELAVTVEDQQAADERIPYLLEIPAARKRIMCEPLIGAVDMSEYLATGEISYVLCGGENYNAARLCDEKWVRSLSRQCKHAEVDFEFFDTGENFWTLDGEIIQERDKRVRQRRAKELGHDIICGNKKKLHLHKSFHDDPFQGESLFF